MKVYTIGFTKKSAEKFFSLLKASGAKTLIDVRLNNVSQLAGFTKKDDLAYFTKSLTGMNYVHMPDLAPTSDMLDEYKKHTHDWGTYEKRFLDLMEKRHVETTVPRDILDGACLLCSEPTHEQCHRRLVAEYFGKRWGDLEIRHI